MQIFDKYNFSSLMKSSLYRPPTEGDDGGAMYKKLLERFNRTESKFKSRKRKSKRRTKRKKK